jgi:L-cysteine:1D-myo-inositol 2-amino-2-deoxy-alpha-D-glucopyranoside ligase
MDGEKMSKSLGNLVFVSELRQGVGPPGDPARHPGPPLPHPWEWHDEVMPDATRRLAAWAAAGGGQAALDDVRAALDDDLDTPGAVAAIDAAAAAGHGVSAAAALLGVSL